MFPTHCIWEYKLIFRNIQGYHHLIQTPLKSPKVTFWCEYQQDLVKQPSPQNTSVFLVLTANLVLTQGMSNLQTSLITALLDFAHVFAMKKKERICSLHSFKVHLPWRKHTQEEAHRFKAHPFHRIMNGLDGKGPLKLIQTKFPATGRDVFS